MSIQDDCSAIETRAKKHGIDMADVLKRGGDIHRKTWARWKAGDLPQMKKWQGVNEALDALIAEREGVAA